MRTLIFSLLLLPCLLFADSPLPTPTGEVILEVRGSINVTTVGNEAHFDRQMIEALPNQTIVTSNHVLSQPATYEGPALGNLLKHLGAEGESVIVTALDDYSAEIKVSDIEKYGVLLATHENGKVMTVDDRGPFFIVFPFDQYEELRKDLYYNMSVWQISSIEVE